MKKKIIVMMLLLASIHCFCQEKIPKEELQKEYVGMYVEEIIIGNEDENEDYDADEELDDFSDDLRDEVPHAPRDVSLSEKVAIVFRILSNVTVDLYHDQLRPLVVRYWQVFSKLWKRSQLTKEHKDDAGKESGQKTVA